MLRICLIVPILIFITSSTSYSKDLGYKVIDQNIPVEKPDKKNELDSALLAGDLKKIETLCKKKNLFACSFYNNLISLEKIKLDQNTFINICEKSNKNSYFCDLASIAAMSKDDLEKSTYFSNSKTIEVKIGQVYINIMKDKCAEKNEYACNKLLIQLYGRIDATIPLSYYCNSAGGEFCNELLLEKFKRIDCGDLDKIFLKSLGKPEETYTCKSLNSVLYKYKKFWLISRAGGAVGVIKHSDIPTYCPEFTFQYKLFLDFCKK